MAKKSTKSTKSAAAEPVAAPEVAATEAAGQESLPINETYNIYDHPIDEITPRGIRKLDQAAVESLAKSIRTAGLEQPIVIGTDGVVVDGDHRLAACKLLGWKDIPVRYAVDPKTKKHIESTDNKAFVQTLVANLQRQNMTPIETGTIFAEALEKKIAADAKTLAGMLGVSTAYVSRYLGLVQRGIPALRDALSEGKVTVEAAQAIISRAKSEADQQAMLDNLLKASDGKITIETVNQAVPPGAEQTEEQVSFTAKRRGRPAGSASKRVTLPGSCMPESGNVSAQLARSADGGWAVSVTVTVASKGKTFQGFDLAKKVQAEIAGMDSAAVRKELEVARERLDG